MFERVVELIGEAAAAKLQVAFPGREIYIPARHAAALERRNSAIRAARLRKKKPASITDLMKEFCLSRRQIWNILKGNA